MPPKVTIIVPVYHVEPYIRECLDSILNQTIKDIQVICVDDGSPDHCPEILDAYAAKDDRIFVIHQKNAGVSAARNAAYPYIKGEYTLFVDSDDWIEWTLCEKAVAVADKENADMTCFFYDQTYSPIRQFVKKRPFTEIDGITLVREVAVWAKLWRTNFLFKHDIRCPEVWTGEDIFVQWKAMINQPKLALLPEMVYHYRINPNSLTHEPSQKYLMTCADIFSHIKLLLEENNKYHREWKEVFLRNKLEQLLGIYYTMRGENKERFLRIIQNSIGDDEIEYIFGTNNLKREIRLFYRSLLGSKIATVEYHVRIALRETERSLRKIRNQMMRRAA